MRIAGTAMLAIGMAARLATTPIGATAPKLQAVIGAVHSVAPTDDATRALPQPR